MNPFESLLCRLQQAFAVFPQPPFYIDEHLYEPERHEYEEMLAGKSREQIKAVDFGSMVWSPLAMLTPEAMGYFLPRLIELAVEPGEKDQDEELFMMRFINLVAGGPDGPQFSLLDTAQRTLIANFLEHLSEEHGDLVKQECWAEVLVEAIGKWRGA